MKALSKLDSRTLALIVIGVFLLLGVLWYYFWLKPTQAQIVAAEQEIQRLEIERNKGLAAKRRLPQLRERIAALQKEIQGFLAALPKEEKFYEVLDLLSKNAKETGVTLNSLTRSPAQSEIAEVASVDVGLRMEAPFPELYAYLKRLESLKRYSSINGVNLTVAEQNELNPRIGASLTVRFYVYRGKGEEEGP